MDWVGGFLVVNLVGVILSIVYILLKVKIERLEKKLDYFMSALDVKWIDEPERERIAKLADQIYGEGKIEEAERLRAQLKPIAAQPTTPADSLREPAKS